MDQIREKEIDEIKKLLVDTTYRFLDFELSPSTGKLFYKGNVCRIEAKMVNLLLLLIRSRPSYIKKELLIQKLWPGQFVTDWALSKLVSDTRKKISRYVGDIEVIRTIRGKGFEIAVDVCEVVKTHLENPQKQSLSINSKLFKSLAKALLVVGVIFVVTLSPVIIKELTPSRPQDMIQPIYDREHVIRQMQEINKNLALTKETFLAQVRRREQFGKMLFVRFPEAQQLSWEQVFHQYFPKLNEEELFQFQLIRAMTTHSMYEGNANIHRILKDNPKLFSEVKSFEQLYIHLDIWLGKYEQVFSKRNDMAILYVGVEDGVGFPKEVDQQVSYWLENCCPNEVQ